MTQPKTLSATRCTLGEGALWHPDRGSFLWFDILGHRLYEHDGQEERHWQFDRAVSAAGLVEANRLLIASERDLFLFDLDSASESRLCDLEADNPVTRSNDGRADPQGGFWIGTMGYAGEKGAGAIYRWHKGELRRLYAEVSIPNAICFAPDGGHAYFTDTPTGVIRRVALDAEGWPEGEPEDWLDLRPEGLNPDGAVTDADGNLWNAQWEASRVACYAPDGRFLRAVALPTPQTTCPAFGGADLSRLMVTSAAEGRPAEDRAAGNTFVFETDARGRAEPRVLV
ncbi:SMP-30/gluconolactonase/LRE family protein [Mameliella sp. CS4]|uniref:SMP-30/gluconolactonase/LRE family protein n=1 Tax=Mameliella sp. CS4 TaxID=2862329 RepID=UPI001C5CCE6A|nr:SMP-30/gluconolactonase/LRE family protein [Mameliella sp. CS4]MBW4981926.1 SMP-30/gluconolactonase/LRE family protein [Mameliella sp. CS4]